MQNVYKVQVGWAMGQGEGIQCRQVGAWQEAKGTCKRQMEWGNKGKEGKYKEGGTRAGGMARARWQAGKGGQGSKAGRQLGKAGTQSLLLPCPSSPIQYAKNKFMSWGGWCGKAGRQASRGKQKQSREKGRRIRSGGSLPKVGREERVKGRERAGFLGKGSDAGWEDLEAAMLAGNVAWKALSEDGRREKRQGKAARVPVPVLSRFLFPVPVLPHLPVLHLSVCPIHSQKVQKGKKQKEKKRQRRRCKRIGGVAGEKVCSRQREREESRRGDRFTEYEEKACSSGRFSSPVP